MVAYLCWSSIHHGRGEDGQHRTVWIQDSFLQHSMVLLHPHLERHIIRLGPATKRMEEENWLLVTTAKNHLTCVLQGVGPGVGSDGEGSVSGSTL